VFHPSSVICLQVIYSKSRFVDNSTCKSYHLFALFVDQCCRFVVTVLCFEVNLLDKWLLVWKLGD